MLANILISGSQPGDATSGRAFSVVSDKIKVVEDPVQDVTGSGDTDDEGEVNTNLIKSAFAQKIHFRLKNEPKEVVVNNSETNALSELTEEMTEVGQITEEEAEVTDDNSAEAPQETPVENQETPAEPEKETPEAKEPDAESGVVEDVEQSASIEVVKEGTEEPAPEC